MIEKPRLRRRASTRLSRQWFCENRDAFATGHTPQAAYIAWAEKVAAKRAATIDMNNLRAQWALNRATIPIAPPVQYGREWACR